MMGERDDDLVILEVPEEKPVSDARRARDWMVGIGAVLLQVADRSDSTTSRLLDKIAIIAACADLSDEMVLRIRTFPNVWSLKA